MSKFLPKLILTLALTLLLTHPLHAQSVKIIKLKDGSALKGEVIQLANGIYTIKTSNLGEIDIPESDILSIAAPGAVVQESTQSSGSENNAIKSQVQQVQGALLSDPKLMMEIQEVMQNEEVMKMLNKLINSLAKA